MNKKSNVVIKNKRAEFDYEFLDKYTAGIVLVGTEIKSIRAGKAGLVDSYCYFSGKELYIKGLHISEYWWGNLNNHDPKRERKLLMTKKELHKMQKKVKEKGVTIIATKLFIDDNGFAKLVIGLAKGKKSYDKRESIKEKDVQRDLKRVERNFNR
jgi:SsrA-binding protein